MVCRSAQRKRLLADQPRVGKWASRPHLPAFQQGGVLPGRVCSLLHTRFFNTSPYSIPSSVGHSCESRNPGFSPVIPVLSSTFRLYLWIEPVRCATGCTHDYFFPPYHYLTKISTTVFGPDDRLLGKTLFRIERFFLAFCSVNEKSLLKWHHHLPWDTAGSASS
jgi:hypothetical protein